MLTIRQTENMGRGVFAERVFQEGDIIEECQVIAIEKCEIPHLTKTILNTYVFLWKEDTSEHTSAMALGNGSLYNHSKEFNATYKQEGQILVFSATKLISAGEQIFINYGYDPHRGRDIYQRIKENDMAVRMQEKRDNFVNEAVDMLQALAVSKGLGGVSQETLSFIVQRYNNKFKMPARPGKRPITKKKLKLVEGQ